MIRSNFLVGSLKSSIFSPLNTSFSFIEEVVAVYFDRQILPNWDW